MVMVGRLGAIALAQLAIAFIVSLNGGLSGARDTLWIMDLTLIIILGVRLLLTLILIWIAWGLVGVWLTMIIES